MNVSKSLLPLLIQIDPSIIDYKIIDQIKQSNAEGNRIQVSLASTTTTTTTTKANNENNEKEYFIKQVIASKYTKKSWADLRRTLMYARTEIRFYKNYLPKYVYSIAPNCYYAEHFIDTVIKEDEKVTDVKLDPPNGWMDSNDNDNDNDIDDVSDKNVDKKLLFQNVNAYIILESLSKTKYIQTSPLTIQQAKQCLIAIAKMYASPWERTSLLKKASMELTECGGSYHLRIRNPKEYQNLISSWDHFCHQFQHLDETYFQQINVQHLGKRIYRIAEYVSDQLTPMYNDPYATIVHGDYKAMNVFLPIDDDDNDNDNDNNVKIIDFASTGLGIGMSDVAMHIAHAVHPSDLEINDITKTTTSTNNNNDDDNDNDNDNDDDGEQQLLHTYLEALDKARKECNTDQNTYPYEVAIRHYKLACIDYFRFVLGRFWKSATIETFEKRKNSPNVVLLNRNVDAAFAFIKKVERYLSEFENEYETKSKDK